MSRTSVTGGIVDPYRRTEISQEPATKKNDAAKLDNLLKVDVPDAGGACVVIRDDGATPGLMSYAAEPSTSGVHGLTKPGASGALGRRVRSDERVLCVRMFDPTTAVVAAKSSANKRVDVEKNEATTSARPMSAESRAELQAAIKAEVLAKMGKSEYARRVAEDYNRAYPNEPPMTNEQVAEFISRIIVDRIESAGIAGGLLVLPPGTTLTQWVADAIAHAEGADARVLRLLYASSATAAYLGLSDAEGHAQRHGTTVLQAYSELDVLAGRNALAHARGSDKLMASLEATAAAFDQPAADQAADDDSSTSLAAAADAAQRAMHAEVANLTKALREAAERNVNELAATVRKGFERFAGLERELAGISRDAADANARRARAEAAQQLDGQGKVRLAAAGPVTRG